MEKKKKHIILSSVILALIIIPIGIYNPDLAYKIPFLNEILKNTNKNLEVEKISKTIGIDKVVPKIEVNEEGELEVNKIGFIKEEDVSKPISSYQVINMIHSMSNTIIKADKIWGHTEITPKTIDIALQGIKYIEDDKDRAYLEKEIKEWKNGDFSNGVLVHNYIWELLNGSVGKATGLNEKAINEINKKNFVND